LRAIAPILLALPFACAPVSGGEIAVPVPEPAPQAGIAAGSGSLRSEQITVELREGALRVRVTPLDAEVLRLTAPDARRRLEAVVAGQRAALAPLPPGEHSLFLVSFQSAEADRGFQPAALTIEAGIQRLRPIRILPLTSGWGEQRLRPLAAEAAVYVFERRVDPFQPFAVHYGATASDAWRGVVPLLLAEQRRALK
jgi:hypothetical protein